MVDPQPTSKPLPLVFDPPKGRKKPPRHLADLTMVERRAVAQEAGLQTAHEAFADRAYTPEGHLVSRKEAGSVLHDPAQIAQRCIAMATGEPIQDVNGDPLSLQPDSICVHGDTPGAVEIARSVRAALEDAGLELAPFSRAA